MNCNAKEGEERMNRRSIVTIGLAMLLCLAAVGSAADKKTPDGTIKLSEGSVAAGIGWSWGHGTLNYKGKTQKFKVEGLYVGEVGITKAEATGNVFNLKSVEDFGGIYGAEGAGAYEAKGSAVTSLEQ